MSIDMTELEYYHYTKSREWLRHVAENKKREAFAKQMYEFYLAIAENVKAIDYAHQRVSSSPKLHQLEDAIIRVEDAHAEWAANFAAFVDEAVKAVAIIAQLEDVTEQRALVYHYVEGLTWEATAEQLHYEASSIQDVHKRACIHLYDFLPLEWTDPASGAK